jgi:hypothetical protein
VSRVDQPSPSLRRSCQTWRPPLPAASRGPVVGLDDGAEVGPEGAFRCCQPRPGRPPSCRGRSRRQLGPSRLSDRLWDPSFGHRGLEQATAGRWGAGAGPWRRGPSARGAARVNVAATRSAVAASRSRRWAGTASMRCSWLGRRQSASGMAGPSGAASSSLITLRSQGGLTPSCRPAATASCSRCSSRPLARSCRACSACWLGVGRPVRVAQPLLWSSAARSCSSIARWWAASSRCLARAARRRALIPAA